MAKAWPSIRSRQLVIVRLGLTPASYHYQPDSLAKALLDAAKQPP